MRPKHLPIVPIGHDEPVHFQDDSNQLGLAFEHLKEAELILGHLATDLGAVDLMQELYHVFIDFDRFLLLILKVFEEFELHEAIVGQIVFSGRWLD